MCKPSESHRGEEGKGRGSWEGGVMDITCYWSTVSFVKKKRRKVTQSIVIVSKIRQMYSELCLPSLWPAKGTKMLRERCSDATLGKVRRPVECCVDLVGKDETCTTAVVKSCFTFGSVVRMGWFKVVLVQKTQQWRAVHLSSLTPPSNN